MSMPSDNAATSVRARFSDGQSARSQPCQLLLAAGGLEIDRDDDSENLIWPYSQLHTHTAVSRGTSEAIIEWPEMPGAQIHVRDAGFVDRLVQLAPQLSAGGMRRRWMMPLLVVMAVIFGAAALIWHYDVKPARAMARLLPDSMRLTLGRSVITQFTSKGRSCIAPAGQRALDALKTRLLDGVPGAEIYNVSVVDVPINNAFAVPGGQMVITNRLIENAKTPDEIAGILAHEIGHGIERHPEASLIRVMGLSFLIELISGGGTGGLGSFGLVFLQTGYVRSDEASADRQALRLLRKARISQDGLAAFFARNAKRRCRPGDEKCLAGSSGNNKGLNPFDLLRTHPYPKDRLKVIRRTAPYASTPALTDAQWQDLRKICDQKSGTSNTAPPKN